MPRYNPYGQVIDRTPGDVEPWLRTNAPPVGPYGQVIDRDPQDVEPWLKTNTGPPPVTPYGQVIDRGRMPVPDLPIEPTPPPPWGEPSPTPEATPATPPPVVPPPSGVVGGVTPPTTDPWGTIPGVPIPTFAPPSFDAAMADPGFQFRLRGGTDALERSAAARGVLKTGGTLKDLLEYGQNFASQEYGNVYNRALQSYDRSAQGSRDAWQRQWDLYTFGNPSWGESHRPPRDPIIPPQPEPPDVDMF